jgi:isoquinoline 1-oxidoreductase subunit beta
MESGVIFGLSAALYGEITIDHGAVVQPYFSDYEMVRFAACREIEVHIHESDAPLGGASPEFCRLRRCPPMPPSLTGIRIRELPVMNHALRKTAPSG